MNAIWKTRMALGLAGATMVTIGWGMAAQAAPTTPPTPSTIASAVHSATPDATLVKNLTFMREEERLARDLYTVLAAKYSQAAPFVNIARSEQRHLDTLGLLLSHYGIDDPSAGRAAGSYADASLQALYDELLASGSESLTKAYDVGIAVENKDIADLEAAIAETSQADVKVALTNLLNGSQNHLAAFTAAKDGEVLGARNGQGMANGRNSTSGSQAGNGRQGAVMGQRMDRSGSVDRPATCPVR